MNIKKLMEQAQKMQREMENKISKIEKEAFTYESNGVKVTILGSLEIQSVEINDSLLADKEMLQDILIVVMNGALKKVEEKKAVVYRAAQSAAKGGGF